MEVIFFPIVIIAEALQCAPTIYRCRDDFPARDIVLLSDDHHVPVVYPCATIDSPDARSMKNSPFPRSV